MRTSYSLVAVGVMAMVLSTSAAGASQERIPELQREVPWDSNGAALTGCVVRGAATDTYILTNVTKARNIWAVGVVQRMTVALSGTSVDVSKHLGHTISVTGSYATLEPAGTVGTEKPVPADVKENDTQPARTFTVKSLKMIADSCSQSAD